jgi:hypothetical protein
MRYEAFVSPGATRSPFTSVEGTSIKFAAEIAAELSANPACWTPAVPWQPENAQLVSKTLAWMPCAPASEDSI